MDRIKTTVRRYGMLVCPALLVASVFQTLAVARDGKPVDQPNIVVILADDLGTGDVGWRDGEIPTPNLDKLALGGARLEQFYVQPVCTPTRAAFLTGRYPIRYGLQSGVIRPWAQYGLPLEEQTLAEGLRSSGYATAIVGKWHLGHFEQAYHPTRRGFDHQYGHYSGAIDYYTHERDGGFDWHKDDEVNRDEGYSTHLITKEAVRLVKTYGGQKPLFLYVPFNAVHSPYQVPEQYLEPFQHLTGQRRTYAGMLTALDEAVGKIVGAIDDAGIRKNTIIFFSSDNGGPQPGIITSNGKLRAGKATHYEGGVRVAAFANWEGKIAPGTVVDHPIHITDLYPTILGLAGAKLSQRLPIDGVDVWDTISKNKPSARKELLINATPLSGAIRVDDWKLVVNGGQATAGFDGEAVSESETNNLELFDLKNDPYEKQSLSSEHPEITQRLWNRWCEYRKEAIQPKTRPKDPAFKSPDVWGSVEEKQSAGNK